MTQNHSVTDSVNDDALMGAKPDSETVLRVPWVVFASGQGARAEYGTTASSSISAALEEEIRALCREFHNALGVQEVPDDQSVVLFWKARQPSDPSVESPYWIITQVLRAPQQPGQRIAYEYFSLALTEDDLRISGNPLHALELVDIEELRKHYANGLREPLDIAVDTNRATDNVTVPAKETPFSQDGIWPATQVNNKALLAYLDSGVANRRTFATWWPEAKSPPAGVFNIVLRSDATRVARPHEVLAVAKELNHILSHSLPAPPSYDTAGGRAYRAMLHNADEVQTMLSEAYSPAALEESPHRWMTRPQKAAGLCQRITDDLPDYATRLPAYLIEEMQCDCAELAERYQTLAHDLQKLRHPNMLHQSRDSATSTATVRGEDSQRRAQGANLKGRQFAFVLAGLLALCLLAFGVRALVGQSNAKPHSAPASSIRPTKATKLPGSAGSQSDQQALALMRARAEREVFRVARLLAAERTSAGQGLSKDAMQSAVMDAIAQAMLQTPHRQIKPAQKRLLFRMATAPIRAKALEGVRAGVKAGTGQRGALRGTRR